MDPKNKHLGINDAVLFIGWMPSKSVKASKVLTDDFTLPAAATVAVSGGARKISLPGHYNF